MMTTITTGIENLLIRVLEEKYNPEIMKTLDIDGLFNMMKEIMTEREYDVVLSRYAIGKEKETYISIARRYGLRSGEPIKQSESYAIRKLRHPKNLRAFLNGTYRVKEESKAAIKPDLETDKLEFLGLSASAYNKLKRRGIDTVKDLYNHSSKEISSIPNIGVKTLKEIEDALMTVYGVKLK